MEDRGWTSRLGAILHLLSSILVFSLLAGCDRRAAAPPPAAARPLYLVASGDTAGWITPCGCTSNQSGGLLRRGTYLRDLGSKGEVVYVDAGGAPGGTSEYQQVKFEAILAGEKQMRVAAHNLGRGELALGPAYLREMGKRSGVPFVSANAADAGGNALAAPFVLVERGGRTLAVVGVTSPRFATDAVRVGDPRQAVLSTIAPLKGRYQSLIVLAYLPDDEFQALAASLPEADVILGGPTGQAIAPRRVGPTLLAAATNKGKFLVQLESPPAAEGSSGWSGTVVELDKSYADDPGQLANLQTYLATLERRDFTAAQSGCAPPLPPGAPADYRIAGSASCVTCHKADHDTWVHSKHAHAWQTLVEKKFHVDPYCMQCHTTGFGLPGGFVSRTRSAADLGGVGCENCHGPSQAHVTNPKTRTTFAAADQCVRCHDHENSPTFAYAAYWPRIRHGGASDGAPGNETAEVRR
jgi:hypothetical protein